MYTDTKFNVIHDFNFTRKHHTTISACRIGKKANRTLCDESKVKLHVPLGQCTLDNNIYIKTWQWLLSRDLHTIYYREQGTWWKYKPPFNQESRRIVLQINTRTVIKILLELKQDLNHKNM